MEWCYSIFQATCTELYSLLFYFYFYGLWEIAGSFYGYSSSFTMVNSSIYSIYFDSFPSRISKQGPSYRFYFRIVFVLLLKCSLWVLKTSPVFSKTYTCMGRGPQHNHYFLFLFELNWIYDLHPPATNNTGLINSPFVHGDLLHSIYDLIMQLQ